LLVRKEVAVVRDANVEETERFDEAPLTPSVPTDVPSVWPPSLLVGAPIALAVGLAVWLLGAPPAVVAAAGLVAAAIAVIVARSWLLERTPAAPTPSPAARRGLVLRGPELLFDDGRALSTVTRLTGSFGVTLLSNRSRSRLTLVLTTPESAFYVGAQVEPGSRGQLRPHLARAFTVASDERALDAAAPDGAPLLLSAGALVSLHDALLRRDPRCSDRVFLTDVKGELVSLDSERLTVGLRALDLSHRLDWHGMLFREPGQAGLAVYQGTYVRQGATEIVFVSLMPALSAPGDPGDSEPSPEPLLERAVLRDLALLRESAEDPPPAERRVAIERVFMLPIRAALSAHQSRSTSPTPPQIGPS
jgi:hypothetical protein